MFSLFPNNVGSGDSSSDLILIEAVAVLGDRKLDVDMMHFFFKGLSSPGATKGPH